jgi:hypothetical protein
VVGRPGPEVSIGGLDGVFDPSIEDFGVSEIRLADGGLEVIQLPLPFLITPAPGATGPRVLGEKREAGQLNDEIHKDCNVSIFLRAQFRGKVLEGDLVMAPE